MLRVAPAASAASSQLNPEQVPSLEERTQAVAACLPVPHGVAVIIGKYAMERFDDQIFGPQQWIDCWGATPVILPSGEEEHPEPTDELYECLNRRVRSQDKLLAGFSCVVTYIPQYVRKGDKILAVTARTLALNLGPNPVQGEAAKLEDPDNAFDRVLMPRDADRTEAPCYFVMERDVAPNTRGKKPAVLIEEIYQQRDKRWQLPEPRNFIATVFSRRVWKGEFLYGKNTWTNTYGPGRSWTGRFLCYGAFSADGLRLYEYYGEGSDLIGACGFTQVSPRFIKSEELCLV